MQKINKKELIKNILLFIFIVLLCFLLMEFILRVTMNFDTTSIISHPVWGYSRPPLTEAYSINPSKEFYIPISINKQGFVDDNFEQKLNMSRKIIFLGDSMTEAIQVNKAERFSEIITKKLNSNKNQTYASFNLGISSTSQMQQYLILKNMSQIIKPNIVILTILTSNDITDDSYNKSKFRPYIYFENNTFTISNFSKIKRNFKQQAYKKCKICTMLKRTYDNLIFLIKGKTTKEIPENWQIYLKSHNFEEEYDTKKKVLSLFKNYTNENSIHLYVIIVGSHMEVNKEFRNELENQFPEFKKKNPDYNLPKTNLLKICQKLNLTCIDSIEFMRNFNKETLHYEIDGHWNKNGHKKISALIYKNIKEDNQNE